MSNSLEGLVREHVAAFNAGSEERIAAGFDEEALFATGQQIVHGRSAITKFLLEAATTLRPTLEISNLLTGGDRVACELVETLVVNGQERKHAIAAFYRIDERGIRSAKVYREGTADVDDIVPKAGT